MSNDSTPDDTDANASGEADTDVDATGDDTTGAEHPAASAAPNGLDSVQAPSERHAERGRAYVTMAALANGRDPPDVDADTARHVGDLLGNTGYDSPSEAALARRQAFGAHDPGTSHDGNRRINEVLGYPDIDELQPDYYHDLYRELDPARAIVDAPVDTTWRHTPEVTDDPEAADADAGTEGTDPSDFEEAVQELFDSSHLQRGLPYYWEQADKDCRKGQYSLLYFGFDDGQRSRQPVAEERLSGPEDLRFVRPIQQTEVTDWELAEDGDERDPGLPLNYTIKVERPQPDGDMTYDRKVVHYSRVIHITDDPDATRLLSPPALEAVLHRLMDYKKVMGASAEMFWVGADRKFFFSRDADANSPMQGVGNTVGPAGGGAGQTDFSELDAQLRQIMHGQKPALYADNMEMQTIEGQAPDPSGIIDLLYQSFSAVTGIPKRLLTGSERGELASSQDAANWYGRVSERQTSFAGPVLVRGTLDMLIEYGILPEPQTSDEDGPDYEVLWESLFEQDDKEVADTRTANAQAIKRIENAASVSRLPRKFLYEEVLGITIPSDLRDDMEDDLQDEPAPTPAPGEGESEGDGSGAPSGDGGESDGSDGPESPSQDDAGEEGGGGGDAPAENAAEQFDTMQTGRYAADGSGQ